VTCRPTTRPVLLTGGFEDAHEFVPELANGRTVVHLKKGGAQDFSSLACSVLKRLFDEAVDRQYQTALIPDADDNAGERDFIDASPLAFDNDDILDADGLVDGDLEACQQAGDAELRGHTDDQTCNARRSEHAAAVLTHGIKDHEHGDRSEDESHGDDYLLSRLAW